MKLPRCFKLRLITMLISFVLSLTLGPDVSAGPIEEAEGPDRILERAEWFNSTRRWPDGTLPAGLRLRAVDEKMKASRMLEVALRAKGRKPAVPPPWRLIGPRPVALGDIHASGRVTALAVDPRDRDVVYLGAAAGGVWKTTDGGQHWLPLTDDQPSSAVGSIALDPTHPDIVYVGTGEANYGADEYFGSGILKSEDGGATWQQIRGPFAELHDPRFGTSAIGSIAVDPSNPGIVLAGAYFVTEDQSFSGVYRSEDAGLTWTVLPVLAGGVPTDIYFSPTGELVYTALGFGFGSPSNGVYRSFDHGLSWTSINGIPPDNIPSGMAVGRIGLAVDGTDPRAETLLAAVPGGSRGAGLLGLFKSTDAGEHWGRLNLPAGCTGACWYDNVLRVHPVDSNVLVYGGILFWVSVDGGLSWLFSLANTHVDWHAFAFSNEPTPKLYLGNDGGVWSNDDIIHSPVGPHVNLNDTLSLTQHYPGMSIDPTNAGVSFAGTQDNALLKYTGNLLWDALTCGDGGETAIDFQTPTTVYASCQFIAIRKSTNGGATFTPAISGIDLTDRVQFIAPLVMDPSDPRRLYFGTFRVYRTDNGAQDWVPISPELTAGTLTTLAVAPSDPNTIYAGTVGGVAVSRNALDPDISWKRYGDGLPSARAVNQIAISSTDPDLAYTVVGGFSGFLGDSLGHVFKTVDGGRTWSDISGNQPNIPVSDIAIDPAHDQTLYIGTDVGVYVSIDDGGEWLPFGSDLPIVPVLSLKLHSSGILRAATHGRSVWDLDVGPALSQLGAVGRY